ncbi:MAG: hypothetical protein KDJ77_08060 [Rhodobiaceae bacterium]|nr:hypothetical protein [Rhodobiaceae bacterium]
MTDRKREKPKAIEDADLESVSAGALAQRTGNETVATEAIADIKDGTSNTFMIGERNG